MEARCPKVVGKKRDKFCILAYQETCRQETSVVKDCIYEMMTERAFVHWMAKPKNGAMDPMEASALFQAKKTEIGAVTDNLGPGPTMKDQMRVAIKRADTLKFRDAFVKTQGYEATGPVNKKATAEDIDKHLDTMRRGPKWSSAAALDRGDLAKSMIGAASSSIAGGSSDGAFGAIGLAASHVPDVTELLSEEEEQGRDSL